MNRRESIKKIALLGVTPFLSSILHACNTVPKTILVVSGWQDVNIGDIAHTPGLLNILQTFLPNTRLILWERNVGKEVKQMLQRNFPDLSIVHGNPEKKSPLPEEVLKAFEESDLMIHGSGPFVVGQTNLEAWVEQTGKPFGIFGVTMERLNDKLLLLLKKAAFIYTRETASLEILTKVGISGEEVSFAPDATFYFHLHDDQRAKRFLADNGLEQGKFICCIPRLRKTPYYKIKNRDKWSEESIREIENLNNSKKEWDHAKLREAMVWWVRETGNKVLLCPEMTYQVDIMNELLYQPLPEDVKPFIVQRGYWLPDEAASVYARSYAVLSFDCHSPIIAAANNTPFLYLRQPEDTIKGQMYYDLNFSSWIFEIEQTEGEQIVDTLKQLWTHYEDAKHKISVEMKEITNIYKKACGQIQKTI